MFIVLINDTINCWDYKAWQVNEWVWSIPTGRNLRSRRRTSPTVTVSAINITLTGPGLKPGLCSDGPATNRLSSDMISHHRCEIPEVSTNFQLSQFFARYLKRSVTHLGWPSHINIMRATDPREQAQSDLLVVIRAQVDDMSRERWEAMCSSDLGRTTHLQPKEQVKINLACGQNSSFPCTRLQLLWQLILAY
jgi:hypothetical protein